MWLLPAVICYLFALPGQHQIELPPSHLSVSASAGGGGGSIHGDGEDGSSDTLYENWKGGTFHVYVGEGGKGGFDFGRGGGLTMYGWEPLPIDYRALYMWWLQTRNVSFVAEMTLRPVWNASYTVTTDQRVRRSRGGLASRTYGNDTLPPTDGEDGKVIVCVLDDFEL